MKKKLALLLALLFFLSGCSIIERGKGANDKGLKDTTDIQYISSNSSMYNSTLVESSDGLLFVDLVNGVKVYACNQPGCQHTGGRGQ
ncbi:MAG: hypothetical protein WAP99_00225 [Caldicoprobacterales bacterium]